MVKIIYLSWNLDIKLLYCTCPETSTENLFNVLFQNPMCWEHVEIYILKLTKKLIIRPRGVFDRIPAFEPGGVRNFNFCPGIGHVSFVCVLSHVVSGRGPAIVLTTHSGRPAIVYLSITLFTTLNSRGLACTSSENRNNHSCFYNVA